MIRKYFLLSLTCASIAVAASVPQYKVQQPLLPPHESSESQLQNVNITLAFTKSGSEMEQLAEIPINTRIAPGMSLPSRLSDIKIVMAVIAQDHSVSLERLDRIMCKITAETGIEEQKKPTSGKVSEGLPWFMLRDGSLRLEDASSKWFLGNKAIESFECR